MFKVTESTVRGAPPVKEPPPVFRSSPPPRCTHKLNLLVCGTSFPDPPPEDDPPTIVRPPPLPTLKLKALVCGPAFPDPPPEDDPYYRKTSSTSNSQT